MEAPEKIYLTKNLLGVLRDGWDALPSEVFTNVEYIRKDALVKYLYEEKGYPITLNGELVHWDDLKSALVAEIKKTEKLSKDKAENAVDTYFKIHFDGWATACRSILSYLDTLEVKDANEALRIEYEKGRADVIADTLSWLENCWPRYCSNPTIIDGFKEAIKGE